MLSQAIDNAVVMALAEGMQSRVSMTKLITKLTDSEFTTRLARAVTELDAKESVKNPNIYRLGHYLGAVQSIRAELARGTSQTQAFINHFVPTRGMHRIARNLALPLNVKRGRWVYA